jgi:phosphonatase-like hydrolase
VALNTGFDRDITELLLQSLNWKESMVDAVVCGDQVREGRPAPYLIFHAMKATATTSVRQVANVGDTVLDLRAGHNAGVHWNIGVLSGAHDRQLLESAPHTHLLPSIKELLNLWSAE